MDNLKIFVTSLLVVCAAQAALDQSQFGRKIQALVESLHSICVDKSHVEEGSIGKVINGEFTDEPLIKAYMKCLLTEAKLMNEKGDLNLALSAELFPDETNEESVMYVKYCSAKVKDITDLEEKAFMLFKCQYESNPSIFIFF